MLVWFGKALLLFSMLGCVEALSLEKDKASLIMINQTQVYKKVLSNGLTVLVKPSQVVPKVSTQLWYNVGSKDERDGEKGIAHLIEHMIFKGTEKLSESDINVITHKLSGYCNAFTSHDYTGYLFDFPEHNWRHALDMLADCMRNCSFKETHLNSELKAVIQELKMYKDNHASDLIDQMITAMLPGHPYTHPIIGYKHDLWSLKRDALVNFYQHHYVPNNATLVVVGAVQPAEVFELAEQKFGQIPANLNYAKQEFYLPQDIVSRTVSIYRDVQQPTMLLAYLIPGARAAQDYVTEVTAWILGNGRDSRLWRKLVDEEQIAVDVDVMSYDLFDVGVLFIDVQLSGLEHQARIMEIINAELSDLAVHGPSQAELHRATRKIKSDYLALLESNHKQAYALGKAFLSTGDPDYLYNYVAQGEQLDLKSAVQGFISKYLRPATVNFGYVLPLVEAEKQHWLELQKLSDQEDQRVLSGRERVDQVEPAAYAHQVQPPVAPAFNFPKYESLFLNNGLEVIYYQRPDLPKINLVLNLKADNLYDDWNLQGLANFVSQMLHEGTKSLSAQQLASELERYGMSLHVGPGQISLNMLSADFEHGLELLRAILMESVFDQDEIEKVRNQLLVDLKFFWDDPSQFIGQILREQIYQGHPYSKNMLGTEESLSKITRSDLLDFYQNLISPQGSRLAIVGDFAAYDLAQVLEKTLGRWQGPQVPDIAYPAVEAVTSRVVDYQINRDQIALGFVGNSVERSHSDYDKLMLFDQIFTGGALRSMSSKLFELREQSGLFYTIGGSLVNNSGKQPGMILVRTIVSQDRLAEAEKQIKNAIDCATQNVSEVELQSAVNAITSVMIDSFDCNHKIAQSFLFLRRFDLPKDYFDHRAANLAKIKLPEVLQTAQKYLDSSRMVTVRVGRV